MGCSELSSNGLDLHSKVGPVRKVVSLLDTADLRPHWTLFRFVDRIVALQVVAYVDREGGVGDRGRVILLEVNGLGASNAF